ncbi:hypothetical protein PYCCODRAFT_283597 [Trametes coccinea BRFM310]|uniref:Uncharacterized protein n=1 Tax=Trametes coccinea (strain BRFM310) TaxID=1353009 RepID=A0A1Y2IPL0_TRAC3|nr:hypothetical protein PYCCODRAFT_283597 [Trametes coccinea BRFM310]
MVAVYMRYALFWMAACSEQRLVLHAGVPESFPSEARSSWTAWHVSCSFRPQRLPSSAHSMVNILFSSEFSGGRYRRMSGDHDRLSMRHSRRTAAQVPRHRLALETHVNSQSAVLRRSSSQRMGIGSPK